MENLYKVKDSNKRRMKVKTLLWMGEVDKAINEFEQFKEASSKMFSELFKETP